MNVHADVARIAALVPGEPAGADHIELSGPSYVAASAFDVDGLLAATAVYSIAAIDALERGTSTPRAIDLEHLLAFCTTHVEVDGEEVPAWDELSGVYETAGGRHIQVHCNFAHHAAGVVERLGCASDRAALASAIGERDAFELEAELISDGLIGAVVRSLAEWDSHPHALATRNLPLVSIEQVGEAAPVRASAMSGLRVLDCSRVLAGPSAGQLMANLGADVMRIGADHLASVPVCVMSTGFGKRNAATDLRTPEGRAAMVELLAGADVWIDAYRPGAMAAYGFTPDRVAEIRPGIVVIQISAFDSVGPWAGRRGYDSIVQSTTGIRWAGGQHGGNGLTGLPVQALDYATGFLAAGVAAQLVAHQREDGGSWCAQVSLLRTRNELLRRGGPHSFVGSPVSVDPRFLCSMGSDFGRVTAVRPFAGEWAGAPMLLGSSSPEW
ncbi:MAG: hypothetical protein ACJAR2_003107 [Ilumatobacter sp.]|jgi:hypothetical protein